MLVDQEPFRRAGRAVHGQPLAHRDRRVTFPLPSPSMPTWPPSCTPRAAPGSPRESYSATGTSSSAPRASAIYLGNTADDVILSALPFSFDAGFSQLTTAFSVGAHVVLLNYTLPADVVRLCAQHRVTGLTGVPPLWIQIAGEDWPDEAARHLRYFANTGGKMPKATLDRLRSLFPGGNAVPDVRADRGVPLHLSRPGRGRPAPRAPSARPFLTPKSWSFARTVRCAIPARKVSWCTGVRSWPWGTGTTQNAPPSASVRLRRANPVCAPTRSPSGQATP